MKKFKVEYNVYNLTTTTTEVESNSEYTEAETKEEAIANVIQYLHDQAVDNGYESEIEDDKLVFENEEFFNFTATEEKTGGKIMKYLFGADLIKTNNIDVAGGQKNFKEFVGRAYYMLQAEDLKSAFEFAKEKISEILESNGYLYSPKYLGITATEPVIEDAMEYLELNVSQIVQL